VVYSNLNGITHSNGPGTGNVYYNNVSAKNTNDGFQIPTSTNFCAIKNNIFFDNGRYGMYSAGGSYNYNYNLVFGNGTDDYSEFSEQSNDVTSDPLFVDAANNEFTLKSTSPAIGVADSSIGQIYDDGLSPVSVWPSSIATLDQDDYQNWEIGAYVFIGVNSKATSMSRVTNFRLR
jgi:hypothetical protein